MKSPRPSFTALGIPRSYGSSTSFSARSTSRRRIRRAAHTHTHAACCYLLLCPVVKLELVGAFGVAVLGCATGSMLHADAVRRSGVPIGTSGQLRSCMEASV